MKFSTNTVALPLQVIALAFLIIATITAPAVPSLAVAKDKTYKYGMLGYCPLDASDRSDCSSAQVSYNPGSLSKASSDYKMGSSARNTLSSIFIVAPIAGGLTLIALIINFVGFSRAAATSFVYWIFMILFALLAFIASTLICIVTILAFYPHVSWPGWILIGAAVCNLIAFVLIAIASKLVTSAYRKEEEEDEEEEKEGTDFGWGYGAGSSFDDNKEASGSNFRVNNGAESIDKSASGFDAAEVQPNSAIPTYQYPGQSTLGQPQATAIPPNLPAGTTITQTTVTSTPGAYQTPYGQSDNLSFVPPAYDRAQTMDSQTTSYRTGDMVSASEGVGYDDEEDDGEDETANYTEGATEPQPKLPDVYLEDEDTRMASSDNTDKEPDSNSPGSSQSGLTSVSQRGVNPNYYRGANQHVNLGQDQRSQSFGSQGQQHQPQQPQQAYPMSSQYYPNNMTPQPPSQFDAYSQNSSGHQYQPQYDYTVSNPYRPQQPARKNRADMILDNSPELQGLQRTGVRRYGNQRYVSPSQQPQSPYHDVSAPAASPSYGYNGYKQRQQQNFPPPSAGDGPYGRT